MKKYPTVLTIAGSDSSAGAGIQADLKSIAANGAYACSAITAITAQNTLGVQDIYPLPLEIIEQQIQSIFEDINIDAVKIGMLHSSQVVTLIAELLKKYEAKNIVVDPVMVATSGDVLLNKNAIESYKRELFSMATVVTPNLQEAETLLNKSIERNQMAESAALLGFEFNTAFLVKGGHLHDRDSKDYLFINKESEIEQFAAPTIATKNTHGTGCTLSSAIAAYLAQDFDLSESIARAKGYITNAIAAGKDYNFGKGNGPVNHFF